MSEKEVELPEQFPDEEPPECPWRACSACQDEPKARAECKSCRGLGLGLGADWLASSWSILFSVPDLLARGHGGAEPALHLLLDPVYPSGGFRIVPVDHPRFREAVAFTHTHLSLDGIKHTIADEAKGIFVITRTDMKGEASSITQHLRAIVLQSSPSRPTP